MLKILGIYVYVEIGFLIFAVICFLFLDKRYRENHGSKIPAGFKKTDEVTIDPGNGKRFRVYYNSDTGERFYHEEK